MKSITGYPEGMIILLYAFRYALGRRTYSSMIMSEKLIAEWDNIEPGFQKQICDDIRHAIKHGIAGDQCDIREWEKVLRHAEGD